MAVTPELLARLEAARASRRVPFPGEKFYQEGGRRPLPRNPGQRAAGGAMSALE